MTRIRFVACLFVVFAGCSETMEPPPPVTPLPPPPERTTPKTSDPGAAEGAATDEGMWLLNDFPSDRVAKKYGFGPTQAWLDHVRLSSVRLAAGCSGSVVSPSGLVMTNHHCAADCIQQLSSAKKDYVQSGFYAKTERDEVKCSGMEVDQLVEIVNVTPRINTATSELTGKAYNDAQKAEISKIEKECAKSDAVRCDVVPLYHGGRYHLYKYRRFQDVRLVFSPEQAIAYFGGDPDNFNFPRYDLDVSFLRIYEKDQPAKMAHFFEWSKTGVKEGDLTFVSGHPGSTSRQLTVSQLVFKRDVFLPDKLMRFSEERGWLTGFAERGKEQKRISSERLLSIENAIKAYKGEREALIDPAFFGAKVQAENTLRQRVQAEGSVPAALPAWDAIAKAQKEFEKLYPRYNTIERGVGFAAELFSLATTLVRAAEEMAKPNEKRLREFSDSNLPAIKARLYSTAPVHDEFQTLTLGMSLTKLREALGPDDPFVKKVLGTQAPRDLAAQLVKGTKLKDVKARRALFEGGKAAVDASRDPMIELARIVDAEARAVRKEYEDKVEAVEKRNSELIAKARFAVYGTSVYPDATFTLRLAFGSVRGWEEAGRMVKPITVLGGAFDRATGKDPFALPKSWIEAKAKLALTTPFNFCMTNDVVGGNSGSPVVDKDGRIVGLVFDGNIHSLGGDFGYEPGTNRSVAVHGAAMLETLDKIYGASRLLGELKR